MAGADWSRAARAGAPRSQVAAGAPRDVRSVPGILVLGCLTGLRRLERLGRVRRVRWGTVSPRALRAPAELVVVGASPAGVDEASVIARLKSDPVTAAIPVLHAGEGTCPGRCGADFCLSTGAASGQLARVAEALLDLARARARSSGLVAAPMPAAGSRASPPAA